MFFPIGGELLIIVPATNYLKEGGKRNEQKSFQKDLFTRFNFYLLGTGFRPVRMGL
jgi:hypothetical protein